MNAKQDDRDFKRDAKALTALCGMLAEREARLADALTEAFVNGNSVEGPSALYAELRAMWLEAARISARRVRDLDELFGWPP